MTPGELNICAHAYGEKRKAELRERQEDIYNLSALIREMVWSKKAPPFDQVFPQSEKAKQMTDDAMYDVVRALNAAFGGTES